MNIVENSVTSVTIDNITTRTRVIFLFFVLMALVCVVALWQIQLIQGGRFRERSLFNRIRKVSIRPSRGRVFDRYGRIVAESRPCFNVAFFQERRKVPEKQLIALARLLDLESERLLAQVSKAHPPSFMPIIVREDIGEQNLTMIEEHQPFFRDLYIDIEPKRLYLYGDLTCHVLGYVGKISAEELAKHKSDGYGMHDYIGKSGIERKYDSILKGWRGGMVVEVDSRGYRKAILTKKDPVKGRDIYLTLDIELQRYVKKVLGSLRGCVVVIDVKTGGLLASYSSPSFDSNVFLSPGGNKTVNRLFQNSNAPLMDRVAKGLYPPGSPFKIVVAIAGLREGVMNRNTQINCPGHFCIGNRVVHCWKKSGHGKISLIDSLKYSCNVYYYNMGLKMGPEAIAKVARDFGFGRKTGIDLPQESSGVVPDASWKRRRLNEGWYGGDTVNYSIGQGFMLVTPLQVAVFMAGVATERSVLVPHLVYMVEDEEGDLIKIPVRIGGDIGAYKKQLELVKQGLLKVVQDARGTGHKAFVPGVKIAGKTGTVEIAKTGKPVKHAWFTGFAPFDDPDIAVVVLVEDAQTGGTSAAPLAGKIFEFYCTNPYKGPIPGETDGIYRRAGLEPAPTRYE